MFCIRQSPLIAAIEQVDLTTPYTLSGGGTYSSKFFNLQIHSQNTGIQSDNSDLITLDRIALSRTVNGRIERGTSFHPTFATSFTGYPTHFSRGYRHNLEFQTTDGGSNYTLLSHNRVQV